MSLLLHPDNLLRVPLRGKRMARDLERRAEEVRQMRPANKTVGVTVLVRTKNDAAEIGFIMEGIRANQEYFAGPLQVVLVDTESADNTLAIARRYKAFFEVTIVPIEQVNFDYAMSLNVGFEAAKHDLVFMIVGHSAFANKLTLAAIARYADQPEVGGAFCYTMPNANASLVELLAYGFAKPAAMLTRPAAPLEKQIMGMLGANCAMVKRKVWNELGGYDVRYAAGGEDSDLGRRMLAAGYKIIIDPVLTVYHSHGLGFIDGIRQFLYWSKLDKPLPFDAKALAKFRSDLGLRDSDKT